jgi:hypothetical protein
VFEAVDWEERERMIMVPGDGVAWIWGGLPNVKCHMSPVRA